MGHEHKHSLTGVDFCKDDNGARSLPSLEEIWGEGGLAAKEREKWTPTMERHRLGLTTEDDSVTVAEIRFTAMRGREVVIQ